MPAVMEIPTLVIPAPPRLETRVIQVVHQAEPEIDNPAHNFAVLGFAWLMTMLAILSGFMLIQLATH